MSELTIGVPAGFAYDSGCWDTFCGVTGVSVWALAAGMDREERFHLTYAQFITVFGCSCD